MLVENNKEEEYLQNKKRENIKEDKKDLISKSLNNKNIKK